MLNRVFERSQRCLDSAQCVEPQSHGHGRLEPRESEIQPIGFSRVELALNDLLTASNQTERRLGLFQFAESESIVRECAVQLIDGVGLRS